jgi:hypothetical protein
MIQDARGSITARMRFVVVVAVLIVAGFPHRTHAQQPLTPPGQQSDVLDPLFATGSTEWMATTGPAFGVVVFHSSPGHKYLLSSLSWGRVLTGPIGSGVWRGRFEWAVEVVPLFSQRAPNPTVGMGVTPLTWRWNFDQRGRVAPFAEVAGGLLWTRDAVPPGTTRGNFTAHASYGVRYFFRPRQAFVASYRFHHISNGNRLEKNPGVNAHSLQVGFSVMRSPAR